MSEKRRALGRGLGALIPTHPGPEGARPVDLLFKDQPVDQDHYASSHAGPMHQQPSGYDERHPGAPGPHEPQSRGSQRHPEQAGQAGQADQGGQAEQAGQAGQADQRDRDDPARRHGGRPNEMAEGAAGSGSRLPHDAVPNERGEARELAPVPGACFAEIPVDAIRPNPKQPRSVFDEDGMAELVDSIRMIGVLQPVVVRPVSEPQDGAAAYELVMGERRWRACEAAGKVTVPAIIKETQDDALLRDALLENLHRSQLNVLEEAAAYQQLLEDFGCTQEELASRIGRSRPQISNTLRLLKLPPLVARRVAAGVLSAGHARALLALEDGSSVERLAQRIVAEGLSVRAVEELVSLGGDPGPAPASRAPRAGTRHPQLDDLAARLSDRLDTRVSIALGRRKGRLTVEFASVEDLDRILDAAGIGDGDS